MLSIVPLDANKAEGNSGATPLTFTVTRSGDTSGTTAVEWAVSDGQGHSADPADFAGGPFEFSNGVVTFTPGATTEIITVNVQGDSTFESEGFAETFAVGLSNPSNGVTIDPQHNSATGTIENDDALFSQSGELSFLARLADAAYHVDQSVIPGFGSHEIIAGGVNSQNVEADQQYADIVSELNPLTAADLPLLAPHSSGCPDFPIDGISDAGVYTDGNAAALVVRSSDSLFISFRGTNDDPGFLQEAVGLGETNNDLNLLQYIGKSVGVDGTPDTDDWRNMGDYHDLLVPLENAIYTYIDDPRNGITHVYVTGHSLGAAMVTAMMSDFALDQRFSAVTFGDPGYQGFSNYDDPRITNIDISGDPAPVAGAFGGYGIGGDVYNVVDFDGDNGPSSINDEPASLHEMTLYEAAASLISSSGYVIPSTTLANSERIDQTSALVDISSNQNLWNVTLPSGIVQGTTGNDLIQTAAAPGGNVLFGNGGLDTFIFAPNFGKDVIGDFNTSADVLQLSNSIFANTSILLMHTADDAQGNAVITDDANDTITLVGITTSQLQQHLNDFHIV
jgi:hypothetical protein